MLLKKKFFLFQFVTLQCLRFDKPKKPHWDTLGNDGVSIFGDMFQCLYGLNIKCYSLMMSPMRTYTNAKQCWFFGESFNTLKLL